MRVKFLISLLKPVSTV